MLARAVLLACLLLPSTVLAQQSSDAASDARALFARGQESFERGAIEAALTDFRAAYALAPLPGFLFNIAQCHRRLGQWPEAADHYQRYLDEVPAAPNRADALALLAEARTHLEPELPAPTEPAVVEPAPNVARPARTPPRPRPHPRRSSSPLRPLAWISLAVGAGLAVTSTFLALRVQSLQDDFDDPGLDCRVDRSRCLALRDDGRAAALWTNVVGVAALTLLATGLVLHLIAPSSGEPDAAAPLTAAARF